MLPSRMLGVTRMQGPSCFWHRLHASGRRHGSVVTPWVSPLSPRISPRKAPTTHPQPPPSPTLSSSSLITRATSAPHQHRPQRDHHHDVIVLGGSGAFGSSIAFHLASRGARVLALDPHPPGHAQGSSHGHTRITRLAYHEGPEYVPLLRRSLDLFQGLQERVGEELFYKTGMLDVGGTFERSLESARRHSLKHEVLTASMVNQRFPGYSVPEGLLSLYQPDGGILRPERIIEVHCSLAAQHGVQFLTGDSVASWREIRGSTNGGGGSCKRSVEVSMASGARHRAGQLVIAAGPWMRRLLPETARLCVPVRQVVAWFEIPDPNPSRAFQKETFPVFIAGHNADPASPCYYGFPEYGPQPGFKIGLYNHLNEEVVGDPGAVDRAMTPLDEAVLRQGVGDFFPLAARGRVLAHGTCLFTNTPDGHFLVDRHPRAPETVVLVSACSGHGFKMSSGIGELVADMVVEGGQGSLGIQEELRIHRIDPKRPGHEEFIKACHR